jgi:xylulokinase
MNLVMGVDLGTCGVRCMISDGNGNIIAQSFLGIGAGAQKPLQAGWHEQNPQEWWDITKHCIQNCMVEAKRKGYKDLVSISVDSTSGTIVPIDKQGHPLRNALMYNDGRAKEEADLWNELGSDHTEKLGYRFKTTFALPKILWIKKNEPEIFRKTDLFIHETDFLVGKLTGDYTKTDHTNALKTGFDLIDYKWPNFIEELIPINMLPKVLSPGERIGEVSCDEKTDIRKGTAVMAGMTDGCASFLASGAVKPGEWNTTIGTTMVIKGVSEKLVKDKLGRVYCHLHPEGYWIPGGASNTGGECLEQICSNYCEFDKEAMKKVPTNLIVYPLVRKGERFPFIDKNAEGFIIGNPGDKFELYAGNLEGVGYVERFTYDLLKTLGAGSVDKIYTTGGGAKSDIWMQIRSNILNCEVIKPRTFDTAFGSAILAASELYGSVSTAVKNMVKIQSSFMPQSEFVQKYEDNYIEFKENLKKRCSV